MTLTIVRTTLQSRRIRSSLTENRARILNFSNRLATVQSEGGIINRIFNFASRLVGFVSTIIRGIAFSATAIFGWLVSGIESLKQFNWNASDADLRALIQAQNVTIATAWGSALGNSFGWIVGIGIGYGVSYLCPVIGSAALARTVTSGALPEALEEISASLLGAVRTTAASFGQSLLINGYMQYRALLKRVPYGVLANLYGEDGASFIKNVWGNQGEPDLSFNNVMDEAVERIQSNTVRAFVESFLEESWDGFTEAGFVVAAEIDAAIEQARAGSQGALGPSRTVLLTPDERSPEETIALTGEESLVKNTIQSTIAQHRMIFNRDVGQIVGQPAEDWYRAKPQRRKLCIVFRDRPRPPWRRADGHRCKQATYSIPDAKTGLTWAEIKRAADAYTWGRFRCTANLENGRQMAVYAASPQEAERKLRQLMLLSTDAITTLSITEEKDRNPNLRKSPTPMYPAFFTLLIRRPAVGLTGRTDLEGTRWEEDHIRVDLWTPEEPPNTPVLR
ncbi:MAG: hypothetical protein HC899_21475 [Leptolyngbyaceae cyanobacterium SM1_4_3]|nr:hypothetical protein [Leptolyngbyaceae cyanobacterium SM1_4_3]